MHAQGTLKCPAELYVSLSGVGLSDCATETRMVHVGHVPTRLCIYYSESESSPKAHIGQEVQEITDYQSLRPSTSNQSVVTLLNTYYNMAECFGICRDWTTPAKEFVNAVFQV
jgi:hypothetical protein